MSTNLTEHDFNASLLVDSHKNIVEFINDQYLDYLKEENRVERRNFEDRRIHCCLYLLSPLSSRLHSLDLITMKALATKLNVVPVIARADALTAVELKMLRSSIRSELAKNDIHVYRFPEDPSDPNEVLTVNRLANLQMPLAVVGSNEFSAVGEKRVRGRSFKWGFMDGETMLIMKVN